VRLDADQETVWLAQRPLADVFETSTDNVGLHLENIYADGELDEIATTEESSVVREEGQRRAALDNPKAELMARGEATDLFARDGGDGLQPGTRRASSGRKSDAGPRY
jgi:hypothetical protein